MMVCRDFDAKLSNTNFHTNYPVRSCWNCYKCRGCTKDENDHHSSVLTVRNEK